MDGTGRPVPHAELWVSERWQPTFGRIDGRADARGQVRLRGLSHGLSLGARAPGYAQSYMQRVPGMTGDEVELKIALRDGVERMRGRGPHHRPRRGGTPKWWLNSALGPATDRGMLGPGADDARQRATSRDSTEGSPDSFRAAWAPPTGQAGPTSRQGRARRS